MAKCRISHRHAAEQMFIWRRLHRRSDNEPCGTLPCVVTTVSRCFAPFVAMLQPTYPRKGCHASRQLRLWCDHPGLWCILPQAQMTAVLVMSPRSARCAVVHGAALRTPRMPGPRAGIRGRECCCLKTASCWRRARFSIISSSQDRNNSRARATINVSTRRITP